MLNDLQNVITERLTGLARFKAVAPALSSEAQAVPVAEVWLAEDKEIADVPAVLHELLWMVQITVGHRITVGVSQQEMYNHIDAVRAAFAGWRPADCVGINKSFRVPLVKILSYQDHGPSVYLVGLVVRLWPDKFARN